MKSSSITCLWIGAVSVVFVTLIPGAILAQDARFRIEKLTVKDGLSNSTVTCVLQDHYGYMWFGTVGGLDRYDGYTIKSYRPDPTQAGGISDYVVSAIAEDSSGSVWVGTKQGVLNKLDRRLGTFQVFVHDPANPHSLRDDHITSVVVDRTGLVWIGTSGGIRRDNTTRLRSCARNFGSITCSKQEWIASSHFHKFSLQC